MLGVLHWFDLKVLDFFISHTPKLAQDSSIVVIEYDDKTAENLSSPTSKLDIAALVYIIEEQKPRVVVLDLFSLYGVLQREDTTMLFEEVLSQYSNICYGIGFITPRDRKNGAAKYSNEFRYLEDFLYPLDTFGRPDRLYSAEHLFKPTCRDYEQSNSVGHLVLKNDVDGIFRRIPALLACGNGALASLGIQAAFDFMGLSKESITIAGSGIYAANGKRFRIPIDAKGQMMIRYNDARDIIREIPMIDIFSSCKNPDNGAVNLSLFRDKLVFIGNTSSRTARFCATPLHSYYPTILMHATVANNVLQHSFPVQVPKSLFLIVLLLFGTAYTLPMLLTRDVFRTSTLLLIMIPLVIAGNYLLFFSGNAVVPIFTLASYITFLLGALIVYRYLHYKNRLLISLKELQEAMRLKERLATIGEVSSKVAHEIRNPLNAIELYASLLRRDLEKTHEAHEHLDIIHEETQRLNRFITRLLGFARPRELLIKTIHVQSELYKAVQLMRPDAREKEIHITCTVPEDSIIMGDPDQLHEIFLNLIKNSIEATARDGSVEIEGESDNSWVTLFFKDTGKGISKKDLEKIFNPFFSTKEQGTGLGLAMVKKIVEAHHGTIAVTSESGKGTCMEIKLPRIQANQRKGARHD